MQHLLHTTMADVYFGGWHPDIVENIRQQMLDSGYDNAAELSEDEVWDWANEEVRFEAESWWASICRAEDPCYWLVIADLGLWNGHHKGGKIFPSLIKALSDCCDNMDDVTIYEDHHGSVTVCGYHHDGRNKYSLYRLSDLGADYYERNKWRLSMQTLCEFCDRPAYRRAAKLRKLLGYC